MNINLEEIQQLGAAVKSITFLPSGGGNHGYQVLHIEYNGSNIIERYQCVNDMYELEMWEGSDAYAYVWGNQLQFGVQFHRTHKPMIYRVAVSASLMSYAKARFAQIEKSLRRVESTFERCGDETYVFEYGKDGWECKACDADYDMIREDARDTLENYDTLEELQHDFWDEDGYAPYTSVKEYVNARLAKAEELRRWKEGVVYELNNRESSFRSDISKI